MEIERYNRSIRNPFKDNVTVIDHISYCMDRQNEDLWFEYVHKSIPNTSNQFRKPHLTVSYSPTPISGFPKIDFETEVYYDIPEEYYITLPIVNSGYMIYIDPFQNRHLVLKTPIPKLIERHNHYLTRGATWPHGTYDPFIIIETNTLHTDSTIRGLPYPNREFVFNVLRYSRFGESIRA